MFTKKMGLVAGLAAVGLCAFADEPQIKASAEYPEFYNGDTTKGIDFIQSIHVLAPTYCSYVKGDTVVVFEAKGMKKCIARCWQQDGTGWGRDKVVAVMDVPASGECEFVFPANQFPQGPLNIRIQGTDNSGHQDYCELQVYNLGGVKWKQGLKNAPTPPGAAGMKCVFADDFDGPLSISPDGRGARYAAHKTGGGDFSGWPFSDPQGVNKPFGQRDTFLRIHASNPDGSKREKGCTGILSSIRSDGSGVSVPIPSYFECRLICHSAPGSWGAFWTLTQTTIGMDPSDPKFEETKKAGCDELDVIECYGGYGPRNPNHGGHYGVTTHFWGQDKDPRLAWAREKLPDGGKNPDYKPPHRWMDAMEYGGKSSWSWTFHTYGVAITETDTVYYLDNIEILRHPTGPVSKAQNTWFLINYAIAGISGWPYDLERYGNQSDMWIDWVRVYCGKPVPAGFGEIPSVGVPGSIGVNFVTSLSDGTQAMEDFEIAGMGKEAQKGWNNVLAGGKTVAGLKTSEGKATSLRLYVSGEAKPEKGEGWGFGGGDAKMKKGNLVSNPEVEISGVPYAKYDLVVHMGAGIHNVKGEIYLTKKSDGSDLGSFAFHYGWNGGKYVVSRKPAGQPPVDGDNTVVFRGLTEKNVKLRMKWLEGKGWTGLAGLQIIPR